MRGDNENKEEVGKVTNRCAALKKHSTRVRVADKKVGKSAGCAQKRSARVWVAHKKIDDGVAPERSFDRETTPKKVVELVKKTSRKRYE